MNLGLSPMMSLNLNPTALPNATKIGNPNAIQFPQTLALVQTVPTSQVTPITQVPPVTAASQEDSAPARPPEQQALTEPDLGRDPVEEFKKYMAMSPAEKMRYAVLADAGLTMEEYEALPAEEKEKIDDEIAERLNDLREAREINNSQQARAVSLYQMEMNRDMENDHRNNLTSIFI
ncbi:hypothetical protein [Saccharospirillum mangrovi]|uniref:hypothetical protein n=1 Tax=Saccharospirillum mangrovi TaxID=2161747 RepID=UPI001300A14B|nr:hypothetical protein [Saccharospirillum mangrovi]